MKFARVVFTTAGVWGLLTLAPLYFLYDRIGRDYPPPLTHPDIYYGFVAVTLVWQIAFLIIASNPIRFRPIMIAAMLEKFIYVATIAILYSRGQMQLSQAVVACPDFLLGLLFVAAWLKTPTPGEPVRP